MLTKRQKQVLVYVEKYISKRDYAPSLEEIKKHLCLSSVSTAHFHIKRLQKSGYLQKGHNRPRALELVREKDIIEVPLVGNISAGHPIEAIETSSETITVTRDDVRKNAKHYALRVIGNSMINEGIYNGDIVIIRKQETAENGQTVVAIIDENETTLKKFYREKKQIRLQPANPILLPIYRREVAIRGVVVKIIRNFEVSIRKEFTINKTLSRRIDYSWDFKGEKTKSYTHGIHTYPAMFIPQVARRLLQSYSREGDTICDIFCGSGTALVESRLLGRNAYGIDLNPLAIFIANAKTTEIEPTKITKEYFDLIDDVAKSKGGNIIKPEFINRDFWFKENIIIQLAKIKQAIMQIKNVSIRNFFLVGFSETVRLVSNTKNGEFKLVRIPKEKLSIYDPDAFSIFKKKIEQNIKSMADYYNGVNKNTWTKIICGNSAYGNGIKEDSIDCIITSPPYGDSRTTVAYGQFSRLSSQWLDIFDDPNQATSVDNELLGGRAVKDLNSSLNSLHLLDTLDKIEKVDEKRCREVLSFYIDLEKCLKQAYLILKKNKYFCLVIGNRLVKQVRIPTDFIIAELSEHIGFSCEDIIVRNIPDKRMPSKNSPTNIVGELEETMTKESIVILKKAR